MKSFLWNVCLFFLPLVLLGLLSENILRSIPNDYLLKKTFLNNNIKNIKVLFLGSSHAYYGVNPAFIHVKSFNAAYVSQTLDFDFEIIKKYETQLNQLQCIAIPISYSSLFEKLSSGNESWRVKNYSIYYGITTSNQWKDHSEVLGNKLYVNLKKIDAYYFRKQTNITCSPLGWGIDFNSKNNCDLVSTGINAAKRHAKINDCHFAGNVQILKSMISIAKAKGIKVLFYTPPAYSTYTLLLNKSQLNQTITAVTNLSKANTNVFYYNFLNDSSFLKSDFYDADHLNEIGAEKFSKKLDTLLFQEVKVHN